MIYAWLVIIPVVFYISSDIYWFSGIGSLERKKYRSNWLFIISFCLISFLITIRYGVGNDYDQYFNVIIPNVINGTGKYEFLFMEFTKLVYPLGQQVLIIRLIGIATVFFWLMAINEQSPYFILSVCYSLGILYVSFFMSGIRQGLAMAMFLYSLKYLRNHQWKHYYVLMLIAAGFHSSAFLYFFLYPLNKVNFKWSRIAIFPVTLIASPFIIKILSVITSTLGLYSKYLSSGSINSSDSIYDIGLLMLEVLVLATYFQLSKEMRTKRDIQLGMNLQLVILFLIGLIFVIPTSTRIILLVSVVNIIYVPRLISCVANWQKRILFIFAFLAVLIIIFYFYVGKYNYYNTLPYTVLWNGQIYIPTILN